MNAQVQEMIAEATRQRDEVSEFLRGLDDETFSRRPEPNRWGPGEQIAHLPITDRPYLDVIRQAQAEGRAAGLEGDGPFRGGAIGNWFGRSMEPPVKRRFKTPKKLYPAPELDRDTVLADFETVRNEMIELLETGDGLDFDRIRMTSPFMKLLKMPIYSAYHVLLIHARRHIWLAKEIAAERI